MYIPKQTLIDRAMSNLANDIHKTYIKNGVFNYNDELNTVSQILNRIVVTEFTRKGANQAMLSLHVNWIGEFLVYIYVNTNVVTIDTYTHKTMYNTDGWYTVTTRKIINSFNRISVFQKNFKWFFNSFGIITPFEEVEGKFI